MISNQKQTDQTRIHGGRIHGGRIHGGRIHGGRIHEGRIQDGWKVLFGKALDTPFASVALMGIIGVLGISMGWIQYSDTASEATQTQVVDNALPSMASKAFNENKYDNASMVKEADNSLADMAGSLQEKLSKDQKKETQPQRQTREQVKQHYNQQLDEQSRQNQQTIEKLGQPAPLTAEQIAERQARQQALAQAELLQNSANNQLNKLEQSQLSGDQNMNETTIPSDSEREIAQVTLAGLEDYVDYQPAGNRPMNAFYGLRGERTEPQLVDAEPVPNAIEAVIHGDAEEVTVTDGSTLKLRLLQDIQVDKFVVPRNSLLTGECVIRGERVEVLLKSIRVENSIMPIQMRVYDIDGHAGIYVPDMALKQQVAQTGSQAVTGGGSLNMPYVVSGSGSAAQMVVGQTAAQGVGMLMTGIRSMAAKKIAQQRATIRPNYHVYLKQE